MTYCELSSQAPGQAPEQAPETKSSSSSSALVSVLTIIALSLASALVYLLKLLKEQREFNRDAGAYGGSGVGVAVRNVLVARPAQEAPEEREKLVDDANESAAGGDTEPELLAEAADDGESGH